MGAQRRTCARIRAVLLIAAAVLAAVSLSSTAYAVDAGTNAWYWPTGHNISSASGSWLAYRTWYSDAPAWHLAFDDCDPYRTPVYALTWGTVLEARTDVGGYGPGGKDGGAMVVLYKARSGQEFKALYGHIQNLKVSKGAAVTPGQKLAELNNYSPPHVHFGIHLGTAYPSSTTSKYYVGIWMGHTHDYRIVDGKKKPVTYGWTDPIAFLNGNRPYTPPPATLTTPSAPAIVQARRVFMTTGILSPKHQRSKRCAKLEIWRKDGLAWVYDHSVRAVARDSGTRSRYEAMIRLPDKGGWRYRASITADARHLAATSGWRTVTAR